jgi:hypothetical protein
MYLYIIYLSAENYHDCVITSCLRRYQHWSLVSILSEFRHQTWPYKLFDFEQFIEFFNSDSINLSINMPDFITIHDTFQVREEVIVYVTHSVCCMHHTLNRNSFFYICVLLHNLVRRKPIIVSLLTAYF